jgi:predicted phosphodiesterase
MLVAVLSDIHANRHAFEAVLDDIADSEAVETWCLGDLVGYGGSPNECVELAVEHCHVLLAGNHDMAVTGAVSLEDFTRGAALAARWTQEVLDAESLARLETLIPAGDEHGIGIFHASPRDPVWEYVTSSLQAELCFGSTEFRVNLIGHSHMAVAFWRPEGGMTTGETRQADAVMDVSAGDWLLNPGSVGQPRDGDPRAAWMLLDTSAWTATWRRTEYDIAGAQATIRAARLPDSLAERLEYGQ